MVLPLSSVARRYITLLLLQTRDIPLMMRLPTALRNAAPALLPNKYPGSSSLRQQTEKGTKIMIYNKIGVQEICLMFNCWSTVKWNMHFFKTVIAGLDSRVIVQPFPRICFLTRGEWGWRETGLIADIVCLTGSRWRTQQVNCEVSGFTYLYKYATNF